MEKKGKALVTTATKVKIVQQLNDFWKMKSMMLRARQDPRVLNDPEFIRHAREYYEKSSCLGDQEFWQNSSDATKAKTIQHLILQEINEPTQLRIVETKEKAAIYIVLSGSVELIDANQDGTVVGPGSMFGSIDLFNKVTSDVKSYRNVSDQDLLGNGVVNAKVKRGAFVRISIADFLEHVLVEDKEDEIRRAQAEDSKIAEIPWNELTDDDKFYVRVYKRARELINPNLFALLDSYRMIPKNSRMPAYKYYHEIDINREIKVDPHDTASVYIIIYGRVRVEIETKRNKEKNHAIACKRKGKKPMVVKTYTMPILLLDEGSILFLKEECFLIGSEGEPKKIIKPSRHTSLSRTELLEALKQQQEKEKSVKLSSTDPVVGNRAANSDKPILGPTKGEPLYKIHLVIEANCAYLKYPYSFFSRLLDDEKLLLKSMANEIKVQLRQSNRAICSRITNLLPWLRGDLSFDVKNKKIPSLEPFRADENLISTKVESLPTEESLLSATMGSFPQYSMPVVDTSSVLTASVPPSLSPQEKSRSNSPANASRSKLKVIIDRIKKDQPTPSIFDDNNET